MIDFVLAQTDDELQQVLDLQALYHSSVLPTEELRKNGFLTVKHDFPLLKDMNEAARHIIAKDAGKVIAYALVMLPSFREKIPILDPMFERFEQIEYRSKAIAGYNYYVMGQVCVQEGYRGRGIFAGLYNKHRVAYANQFDCCVTEISTRNLRSIKAHQNVGFEHVYTFKDETDEWNVVVWDWK
ncbi:MAG TPA: GNAT family N-acetyltransferase [Saprospiraceae bacterium]|nr:GNAT family N-acetyltransferase [Saprospiraceae bacterium]HMQ84487.1 GNAT family N-acetyltransferase [Saprospiraceae bacterium]